MKISIITPSVRKEGLKVVRECLKKQTFAEWEWLIGSEFDPKIKEARWIKDDFKSGFWSLNRIYNKLIEAAQGELILSWQDWIWGSPTALEQFWQGYQAKPEAVISGVGDQYEELNEFGKPHIKIWSDPRKRTDLGSFYEINFVDAEFNFCAVPRKAFFDAGGFDEELDMLGVGGDQFQLCERLNDMGKQFYIDQSQESFTKRHDRTAHGGEEKWNKNHVLFNGEYAKRRRKLMDEGKWPILDFLKKN